MSSVLIFMRVACLASLLMGCSQAERLHAAPQLHFDGEGRAALPKGYRSWVHVATSWEPIGLTILDGTTTRTPEILNVYVEPSTYQAYMATGAWPDGALLAKEFSITSVSETCDGAPAYICSRWYGKGIFQNGYTGLGVMLKDKARFPDEPGNWAYFSYGHRAPPYEELSPPRSREQCAQCHIDHVEPSADYVFSAFHIGLDRTRAADGIAASLRD